MRGEGHPKPRATPAELCEAATEPPPCLSGLLMPSVVCEVAANQKANPTRAQAARFCLVGFTPRRFPGLFAAG